MIQIISISYFFLSVMPLKNKTKINRFMFYTILAILAGVICVVCMDDFIMKMIFIVLSMLVITSVFCEKSFLKKLLYIAVSVNVLYVLEAVFLIIVTLGLRIDITKTMTTLEIVGINAVGTFFISLIFITMGNYVNLKSQYIKGSYIFFIAILTFIQTAMIIISLRNIFSPINKDISIVMFLFILLSYALMQIFMKKLKIEYKYKENTIFIIEQYEQQLNDYLLLHKNEEEIQYIRHEIINQLISLEAVEKANDHYG